VEVLVWGLILVGGGGLGKFNVSVPFLPTSAFVSFYPKIILGFNKQTLPTHSWQSRVSVPPSAIFPSEGMIIINSKKRETVLICRVTQDGHGQKQLCILMLAGTKASD